MLFHRGPDAVYARLDPFFYEVTKQLLSNSTFLAQISLNFLRHHYLRRRVEEVAAVLQEWVCKALNADDQLLHILLLWQP